ncbi:MAG: Heat-inducible transcription repressor HrcA [Patescibacteria group bacterium]|nr:Heat-inducible transcription repressor HrcA [Patescibacteria group bacterium]
MHNLTQRQVHILKAIIEEYINTADAVGSETLEKKYSLSASPATIRNEMVRLSELGYLKKLHSSAGRVPTPMGMKFYVKELMKEKVLSTVEEVALKEKIWDYRETMQRFLKEATKSLAHKTGALAIATTNEGDVLTSGYANILDMPEFFDIDITKALLSTLDEYDYFHKLCKQPYATMGEDIYILMGDELGQELTGPYSFVFTHYETPEHGSGEIGVIGPVRLNYTTVVPTVRYFGTLIESMAKGW